jgi:hypothetical protein
MGLYDHDPQVLIAVFTTRCLSAITLYPTSP